MRILILANLGVGLYKFRKELIKHFLDDGNEVTIALPDGKFVNELKDMGCDFINTPMERRGINPFKDLSLVFLYRRIVKSVKPDYVITYTVKPNIYGGIVCACKKIPYIMNITGLGTAFQKKGFIRSLVTFMYKAAAKKARKIIFENSGNMNVFINSGITDKKHSVLNPGAGVNIEEYAFEAYPERDEIRFLFIGRIMKEKGVDELFAAAERIKKEYDNICFDVVGPLEDNYKERIDELTDSGVICYYGFQSDVKPFIKNASCFVLPSWHEGMANTNLECAAMGRPVITSNIHGCLEAVEDGVSGYLSKPHDAGDLYEKLVEFISLPQEKKVLMGRASRMHIEKIFDKKIVVKKTAELLYKKPLRVLVVIGSMNRGGAESMIMNYYRRMDCSKVQFDFVENTDKRAAYDDEIEEMGGKIYYCPHFKGYNYFSYRKWWKNFFKEHKEYRIIHGHIESCAAIYLAQAKKNGLIAIAHSHNERFESSLKEIPYRFFSYPTRHIADYFFGCSQNALVSRYGKKISESDNSYVIFNAVDIQKFQFNETYRAQIRDKYNLRGKTVIGQVARFCPVKNHTFLIDVFSVLNKMHPDTVLMLFGTGETEEMIKSKVRELGIESSVMFMGAIADVNMYLSALDLFILPSVYEGLPVSVIEAQANGVQCLLSDTINKASAVTDSVSFLPLEADKKEWAEKMYELAKMPRSDNADAVSQAGYDIKTKAEWLEQFYLDL